MLGFGGRGGKGSKSLFQFVCFFSLLHTNNLNIIGK